MKLCREGRHAAAILGLTLVPALPATDATSAAAWQRLRARSAETLNALARVEIDALEMEPGVVELSFAEFFEPVGEGGLEYTARLRSLAGKRVRLSGYMVREERRHRGLFLLARRSAPA